MKNKQFKPALRDGMVFTEKSQTMPGQAFTASEILRRSLNGTMPAIYQEGLAYDFEDLVNGKQVTFGEQEFGDEEPIPNFPSLEDVFDMRDSLKEKRGKVNELVKKHLQQEQEQQGMSTALSSQLMTPQPN